MIDQTGFEISRPRTINLKMPLSRFDFNRKQRLLLKWIVTAGSRDNRLVMTGLLPEQPQKALAGCISIAPLVWISRLA